jgi:hypothetical protein
MGLAVKTLDKQINNYPGILNTRQKKALLTVAKTFAEEHAANDYSDEFKAELDSRYEEYKNGGKLISEAEANKCIRKLTPNP